MALAEERLEVGKRAVLGETTRVRRYTVEAPVEEQVSLRRESVSIERRPVTGIVVTHDMKTAQRVADRVVMLHPLSRLESGEGQILFDGTPVELEQCADPRVRQFVEGHAAERLSELKGEAT